MLSFNYNTGTSTNSSHGQLEEACCQRLNSLAEVLSVSVACSLKGPPSEQIIKLLGTIYRLLKSATLLTKAPQSASNSCISRIYMTLVMSFGMSAFHTLMTLGMSFGVSAFHTLMRRWACLLASLHFTLVHDTGHVMWHVCTSHVVKLGHSTWCVIRSFADLFYACVCISVVAD